MDVVSKCGEDEAVPYMIWESLEQVLQTIRYLAHESTDLRVHRGCYVWQDDSSFETSSQLINDADLLKEGVLGQL